MDNFRNRLKKIIEEYFRGRFVDFSRDTGIENSAISRWLSGVSKPTIKNLIMVRNIGLNEKWLLTGEEPMWLNEQKAPAPIIVHESTPDYRANAQKTRIPDDIYIKLVSVPVNAGKSYSFDDIPEMMIPVSRRFNSENHVAFKISGNSMSPLISDGYIVIVDTRRQPLNNDIVVCQFNNELLCKRLKIINEGHVLVSDNPDYVEIQINGLNNCRVVGTVVHVEFNFY